MLFVQSLVVDSAWSGSASCSFFEAAETKLPLFGPRVIQDGRLANSKALVAPSPTISYVSTGIGA